MTSPDTANTQTLNRLLAHLDRSLSPSSPQAAKASHYELNKVRSNIEYARTLLLTLEKQASTIRVQNQRQSIQADLAAKRELIKRLNQRVAELEEAESEDDNIDDSEEDETEDASAPSYAPARSDTDNGLDTGGGGDDQEHPGAQLATALQQSTLRSRRPELQASDNHSAASTTARENLFSNRTQQQPDPSLSLSETLLSHNRTEQESLTTGLLGLAKALKESSLQFGASLEAEKYTLKRAEGGLDKSAQGMEAAERKMGMLRKMSEGQGWWGRIKLYAFIFGLWVACFLIVFVGPKLRL